MNTDLQPDDAVPGNDPAPSAGGASDSAYRRRMRGFAIVTGLLLLAFGQALWTLTDLSLNSAVLSYILLVPFISGYLIYVRKNELPHASTSSFGSAAVVAAMGMAALAGAWALRGEGNALLRGDSLALVITSFLCLWLAGAFAFLGSRWLAAAAFPVAFLALMIPLPNHAIERLETASKLASAEAAEFFFNATNTPNLRDGNRFQLPGIVIEVAQECSGIRSSLVLIITSLLAANMFLKSPWRRAFLVAVVIPLGVLRNGFRILVIGMLCVYQGPHMIDSPIHHQGGPVFFVLSLIPLFALLWWLRRGEARRQTAGPPGAAAVRA